jgi:hypothetical protein
VKQSVQAVKQTFDPLKMLEKVVDPNAKNDKGMEQLEKDKGKNAIIYSIGGMVLTLVAWAIVNIVISIVT